MNHEEDRRRQLGYAGVQMSKVRCKLRGMGRGIRDREGERLGTSSSRVSEAESSQGCIEEARLGVTGGRRSQWRILGCLAAGLPRREQVRRGATVGSFWIAAGDGQGYPAQ